MPDWWKIIDYIIDFNFFCDLVITFFTALMDDENNLNCNLKDIALNYLKGWFIVDFFASIPVSEIFILFGY
jgi:potassium voltage-gated channel Eag-related subfamily H protein 8